MTINEIYAEYNALKAEQEKVAARMEQLGALIMKKSKEINIEPYRANHGDTYFCLDRGLKIEHYSETDGNFDKELFRAGNYYETLASAERDAENLKMRNMIRALRDAICPNVDPSTANGDEDFAVIAMEGDEFIPLTCVISDYTYTPWDIHFDTYDNAAKACAWLNEHWDWEVKEFIV